MDQAEQTQSATLTGIGINSVGNMPVSPLEPDVMAQIRAEQQEREDRWQAEERERREAEAAERERNREDILRAGALGHAVSVEHRRGTEAVLEAARAFEAFLRGK